MMSELISTSRSEALAYACQSIKGGFPILAASTVDALKLASLALLLEGKELREEDVISFGNRFEDIANQGEDGPWLYRCPRALLILLANLHPTRVPDVAKVWVLTEEAQLDQWIEADTIAFLTALSYFCARTIAEENDLFLLVCV